MPIVYILSLMPVIIWAFMEPLALRFTDLNTITTSIGQILGLVGMTLFAINLILASRFKFLDKYFKGLDKVYSKHHKIGAIAFSMLLFHPIFLVIKYILSSVHEAALFFVPFLNMPVTWGIISLLIMVVLIVATFYIKLKYHKWKLSHKFMTLAFLFAVFHTIFITSDISRNILLKIYILGLSTLAILSIFWKVYKEKIKRFEYKISGLRFLNKDIIEIEMIPAGKSVEFKAGQFIFINFNKDKLRESHPFTISSSPENKILRITVKNFGDFTNELKSLKIGDMAYIIGPYGDFSYQKAKSKNQIWLAGGIGITPFMSMSESLLPEYNINLYYCLKNKSEAVYYDELLKLQDKNNNFKIDLWCSDEQGFITIDEISQKDQAFIEKDYFLCGPPKFMESLKNQLLEKGVDKNKIHYENFGF